MKQKVVDFWNDYWKDKDVQAPATYTAWQFGTDPDTLAKLVSDKIKTATCSAHIFYQVEKEPLPKVGDYSVVLNSLDDPVVIIKTTDVTLAPMNQVPEEFAIAEGEGDRTYSYWWHAHETFFTEELRTLNMVFKEDMLLVCERFEVLI
ncbi:ASCH domain-containing protein [Paraliobacillus sediminis]|uniref:ASCH domain-containing protein n=1 Tax=Paraliobacillus sediminis TaxID=1885916 RepID=UPI000E3D339A|nr:ASCH domain-containing protein [Paraliobacillus sediminis]